MTTKATRLALTSIVTLLAIADVASAQRGRGGMVGNRGGGGGNVARPNFNQNFSRPNFNQNVSRPNFNQNMARPNFNQNVGRPNINPNIGRENFNRPNITPNINPNIGRQNFNPIVNRPNNFNPSNVNRQNFVNNSTNINNTNINNTNINRINNVNQVNNYGRGGFGDGGRGGFGDGDRGGYGGGYGGYGGYGGGYRGWGGYPGAFGGGYNANSYYGYNQNWVNGSWGGNFRPGWGGYGGYGNYYGSSLLGLGAGVGIASWGLGSLLNNWGYNSYSNPYYGSSVYAQQPAAFYDYSRPLDLASEPPAEPLVQTAQASLEAARDAFHAGDYPQALALADQALTQTPNDPMLHEFRAVCLFALGRYDEAAVPFYTVLSAGPGWDWTTMIGLYPDVETYTAQLRALEAFCNATPQAGSARFVLAALYLTQGSTAAAATRLRQVVAIQPQDRLSSQLLAAIDAGGQPRAQPQPTQAQPIQALAQAPGAPTDPRPPADPVPAQAPPLPTGPVPANLVGSWTSSPSKDVAITLAIGPDKTFGWKVVEKGQAREFKGEATFDNDVLALVSPQMPPMVAKVNFTDPARFHFKAVATPAEDPGLDFAR